MQIQQGTHFYGHGRWCRCPEVGTAVRVVDGDGCAGTGPGRGRILVRGGSACPSAQGPYSVAGLCRWSSCGPLQRGYNCVPTAIKPQTSGSSSSGRPRWRSQTICNDMWRGTKAHTGLVWPGLVGMSNEWLKEKPSWNYVCRLVSQRVVEKTKRRSMCFTNGGYYLYLGLTRGLPTELTRRCSGLVLVG